MVPRDQSYDKEMRILGVNLSNNGSICVVEDGQIDFYLEAERVTRVKRDSDVSKLLDMIDNIDVVAIADAFWNTGSKTMNSTKNISKIKRLFPDAEKIDYRDRHHLTHAACGFYNSGFTEAAVIVVDSSGSHSEKGDECETIFHCKTGRRFHWKVKHKEYNTYKVGDSGEYATWGIGKEFDVVAESLGLGECEAGKVMGLAPHNTHLDATRVQKEWEDRSVELVEKALATTKQNNIILTGGCFLNCVVNYKLTKAFPGVKFYAEPVSHDGGTAIGSAYLVHHNPKLKSL